MNHALSTNPNDKVQVEFNYSLHLFTFQLGLYLTKIFVVKQIAQGENKLFDRPSVEIYIFGRSQLHNPQTNSSSSKWWFQLIWRKVLVKLDQNSMISKYWWKSNMIWNHHPKRFFVHSNCFFTRIPSLDFLTKITNFRHVPTERPDWTSLSLGFVWVNLLAQLLTCYFL